MVKQKQGNCNRTEFNFLLNCSNKFNFNAKVYQQALTASSNNIDEAAKIVEAQELKEIKD